MVRSKSLGSKIFDVFNTILMTVLALSCIYPLWYAFCLSISSKSAANSGMVTFYPVGFSMASYQQIMGDAQFFRSFLISTGRTVLGTAFTILVLVIFAYPLSKPASEYRPRNVIMWIVIFCMLFNGGTIPWYITMVKYHMINSMVGLILCGGVPVFNLILLVNFYRSLPRELIEAARVDGANAVQLLFRIILPAIKPVLATTVILDVVWWFKHYTIVELLTSGGPNSVTSIVSIGIYKEAFQYFKFGRAAAMAVVVFVICYLISKVFRKVLSDDE